MDTQDVVENWKREVREAGFDAGRDKGLEEGELRALRTMLGRQLRTRFGALDTEVQRRIDQGSKDELDRWIERVVLVERLPDVFER